MNIFVTNICPVKSAQALDDKRVVKMVLESAQLLSTAIFINSNIQHTNIYKATHINHPCSIWSATNKANWDWLLQHFIALCEEYNFRYSKTHKTGTLLKFLLDYRFYLKDGDLTPFPNCTKLESLKINFQHISDIHSAYKMYLKYKWNYDKVNPKWTKRPPPLWIEKELEYFSDIS